MANESKPESIFFAALEIPSAEERAAFLDDACGEDHALRHRIDRLLAAYVQVCWQQPVGLHTSGSVSVCVPTRRRPAVAHMSAPTHVLSPALRPAHARAVLLPRLTAPPWACRPR